MLRITETFYVKDISIFKTKMLGWLQQFSIFCFLDSNSYADDYHIYDLLVAADANKFFTAEQNVLGGIRKFLSENEKDWLFGHFNYDLKDETEPFTDENPGHRIGFPKAFLFKPEIVIAVKNDELTISTLNISPKTVFNAIGAIQPAGRNRNISTPLHPAISKAAYLKIVEALQSHIHAGDCYEINFCQEFFAEHTKVKPHELYATLSAISPMPFAAFYKIKDKYLICASPERYIAKQKNKILSQPIKGTAPRDCSSADADAYVKQQLVSSFKNKTENVMIVDLVRNDLSRLCKKGTVHVEALYAVHTYPQVHQMISTITGETDTDISFADVLAATFPMGSMTGAPKKKVMELIAKYETTKRGIFSGTVGYISPENNFDFNVVIRSIMYDNRLHVLSYHAGSAITAQSNAEDEYEECLIKAMAIEQALKT